MEESNVGIGPLSSAWKGFARRLLAVGENRLELLTVEALEGRERLSSACLLAFGAAAFGLLTGMTLTAGVVVLSWAYSPVAALLTLTGLYGLAAVCHCQRLAGLLRNWEMFSASLDQLRKDSACLEKILE